jgi:heat-inducible transcriptional repressor
MSKTAKSTEDGTRDHLTPREREVLKSVIRSHIVTGEPVGSKTVSEGASLDLSPATIRNVMSDLEERGLLNQPHTSAGRIPTDRAYRLYVDRLMGRPKMSAAHARAIDEAMLGSRGGISELLEEASRQLSRFSHQVGVVLAPELRRIVVEQLEFVRLGRRRVVAIVVGKSGLVHNRIFDLEEPIEQDELDTIGRQLSERYTGRTLPEMRAEIRERQSEAQVDYDRLLHKTLELGRRAAEGPPAGGEIFIEGTSNLLGSPDFTDLERMRSLLQTLEEKERLVDLLGRVLGEVGTRVVIGEENPMVDLADCSVIASSYGTDANVMGTVGIVGPTRMEYARAVALVDYLARVLSRLLSGSVT